MDSKELITALNSLEKRIESIERKLESLPIPFKLMYRPPTREDYVNVVDFLDETDRRLELLEDGICSRG